MRASRRSTPSSALSAECAMTQRARPESISLVPSLRKGSGGCPPPPIAPPQPDVIVTRFKRRTSANPAGCAAPCCPTAAGRTRSHVESLSQVRAGREAGRGVECGCPRDDREGEVVEPLHVLPTAALREFQDKRSSSKTLLLAGRRRVMGHETRARLLATMRARRVHGNPQMEPAST